MKFYRILAAGWLLCLLLCLSACSGQLRLRGEQTGMARFCVYDNDIYCELKQEDQKRICELLDDAGMESALTGTSSCGFTEGVSVEIDGLTLCIANDMCPIVWVKEKMQYASISEEANRELREILTGYGFYFPCI